MQKITTALMFEGNAAEAMEFYLSLFPDSQVLDDVRYGAEGPGPEGTIMFARFKLAGMHFICMDSPINHGFTFTPSTSHYVECRSAEDVDRLFEKLSDGGEVLMALGSYPFSQRYAWVKDRFGVSWQLTLQAK